MKFFFDDNIVIYPDTAQELKTQIILDSTVGPQKQVLAFFKLYFNGSDQQKDFTNHPLLGDLKALVTDIEDKWDVSSAGLNVVTTTLRLKLGMSPYPFPDPYTPGNTPEDQSPSEQQDQLGFRV